jgi:hypothetical protein
LRRLALRVGTLTAAVGLLVLILLLFTSAPRERVLDGYVLFVGGVLLLALVEATRGAGGPDEDSPYERALRRRPRRALRPPELGKIEREVALAAGSAFDLHFRLRPILREVARHRLSRRRGLDLDAGAAETRALLGDELWELTRPDRPPPDDRLGPGLPLSRLRAALDALERI